MSECPGCGTAAGDSKFCAVCGTSMSLASSATIDAADQVTERRAEARLGQVVGKYRLLGLLGEGGMGSVFRAEHTKLGRKVALEMLHSECSQTPAAVRRFFEEARLVNQIAHENIVQITDFIEEDGGDNYYIMEMLRGVDLRQLQIMEGVMPLERALHIAVQICSALAAVHGADIVHRDLKPANVFLTHRGRERDFVKLLDFGVAKFLDVSEPGISMHKTASGVIVGTPGYMSPEQACGRDVDHLTDIYALGIMLYVMVTGRSPFRAKSFGEMVVKHSTVTPVAPSL